MTGQEFEDKVKAMTIKEIFLLMVESLRNPAIPIHMDVFGAQSFGVCYGCAATNIVCKMMGKDYKDNPDAIEHRTDRSIYMGIEQFFLKHFENSIDFLRQGKLEAYNLWAIEIGLPLIPGEYLGYFLPDLDKDLDLVDKYEDFANQYL